VVYGLWAIFVLVPILNNYSNLSCRARLGAGPGFFTGRLMDQYAGGELFSRSLIPIYPSITREVLNGGCQQQSAGGGNWPRGATRRWEMIRISVLRNARAGLWAASSWDWDALLGETMAVTMVDWKPAGDCEVAVCAGIHHGERAGQ